MASRLLKMVFWRQLWANLDQLEPKLAPSCLKMGSSWPQVGASWAQVGSKLAQVGPKISSRRLQEALLKGPGRVQGGSWSQKVLQEAPGVQKWPPRASKMTQKWCQKASNLIQNLSKIWLPKASRSSYLAKKNAWIKKPPLIFFVSNLISWPKLSGLGLPKLLWYKHFSLHRIQYCDGSCLDLR